MSLWNGCWFRFLGVMAVVCSAGLASAQDVREAKAVMKDGRTLEGVLVLQNDRVVVLNISGIETTLNRGDLAELEVQQTARELYDEVRPTLADTDLAGRLDLAERMVERDAFPLARQELSDLSRLFPGDPRIARLDTQIAAQEALAQEQVAERDRPEARGGDGRTRRTRAARPEASDLLSEEQINLIRVYEVDLSQEPRGITIEPDTLEKFFSVYRDGDNQPLDRRGQSQFRRLPGYEQLDAVFSLRDRSLYEGVRIVNDPPALAAFRSRVNGPYVVNYFRRHFGPDAPGDGPKLPLAGSRPTSVEEAYTNFFVLNGFTGAEGIPMIDRRNPAESLLVQWGLPRDRATHPAPDVPGWEPAFRGVDDARFGQIVDWITSLYPSPPANYGISFTPGDAPAAPDAPTEAESPSTPEP